jgi:hypothetical protein
MNFLLPLIALLSATPSGVDTSYADDAREHSALLPMLIVDEVHIKQEKGYVFPRPKDAPPYASKPLPEGATPVAQPPGPTTCNSGNSASPECHTATQQGRGK